MEPKGTLVTPRDLKKHIWIGNNDKNLWMAPSKATLCMTPFQILFMNDPKPKYLCMTIKKDYG